MVFERLFGDAQAKTPEERASRRAQDRSILDSITGTLTAFKRSLPPSDQLRVDEYADSVREIERRLTIATKATGTMENHEGIVVPAGVPDSFDEHIKLQFDLQALAYQGDITRVSTLLYARDLTGAQLPGLTPATPSFHGGSHHAENPDRILDYSKINRYHVACLAYFLDKLRKTQDGDGTLLDHTLILYGTNMGDSNHDFVTTTYRTFWWSGASRQLKGGRHLAFPSIAAVPHSNLLPEHLRYLRRSPRQNDWRLYRPTRRSRVIASHLAAVTKRRGP